jgi:hypothetical protein
MITTMMQPYHAASTTTIMFFHQLTRPRLDT